ncbi:vesicle-fusing ATPase, partial [Fonticula alba]
MSPLTESMPGGSLQADIQATEEAIRRVATGPQAIISLADLRAASTRALKHLNQVPASAGPGGGEIPSVPWDAVGGLEPVKAAVREIIELPRLLSQYLGPSAAEGLRARSSLLLFGPPGTGKTLVAKAIATGSKTRFMAVKGAELLDKWVGESERRVSELFERA